jgi:MFS family permease
METKGAAMGQGYALPSSLRLELEAQRLHATSKPVALGDLAPAMVLSGIPQGFDLAIGALAAVLVFPQVFFPGLDRAMAIWAGFAVWGAAYLAKPLGERLFAEARRRHGRGVQLTAARFIFGASTAAVTFLPGAAQAGAWAVVLLLACRIVQGLAMGGAATDPAMLEVLGSSKPVLARAASVRSAAGLIGLAVGATLLAVMAGVLSREDFLEWGWRYPFVLGIGANIVALFAQLRLLAVGVAEQKADRATIRLASAPHAGSVHQG